MILLFWFRFSSYLSCFSYVSLLILSLFLFPLLLLFFCFFSSFFLPLCFNATGSAVSLSRRHHFVLSVTKISYLYFLSITHTYARCLSLFFSFPTSHSLFLSLSLSYTLFSLPSTSLPFFHFVPHTRSTSIYFSLFHPLLCIFESLLSICILSLSLFLPFFLSFLSLFFSFEFMFFISYLLLRLQFDFTFSLLSMFRLYFTPPLCKYFLVVSIYHFSFLTSPSPCGPLFRSPIFFRRKNLIIPFPNSFIFHYQIRYMFFKLLVSFKSDVY